MISGTESKLKFKKLKRRLKLTHWQTVGLLESIWMFTAQNAIRGDIGRHSNEDIAAGIEWMENADELIDALVECGGWLDRCPVHRLVVHDWEQHCPTWVKGNVKQHHSGEFAVAHAAHSETHSESAPAQLSLGTIPEDTPKGHPQGTPPRDSPSNPSQSKPILAKPNTMCGSTTQGGNGYTEQFEQFWSNYPKGNRRDKKKAFEVWKRLIRASTQPHQLEIHIADRAAKYAASWLGRNYTKLPATWLRAGSYDDDPAEWEERNAGPNKDQPNPFDFSDIEGRNKTQ